MTTITGPAISRYRLLVLRAGLKLEMKGLRHSRGRWHMAKQALHELELDWVKPQPRMTRSRAESILRLLEIQIDLLDEEAARASHPHPLVDS